MDQLQGNQKNSIFSKGLEMSTVGVQEDLSFGKNNWPNLLLSYGGRLHNFKDRDEYGDVDID